MFVTFITIITIRGPFYQIMDYRDTRAYILDPCIQEFFHRISNVAHLSTNMGKIMHDQAYQCMTTETDDKVGFHPNLYFQ